MLVKGAGELDVPDAWVLGRKMVEKVVRPGLRTPFS